MIKKSYKKPRISGRYFRLVIPNLTQYVDSSKTQLESLKKEVQKLLQTYEITRGLKDWIIAIETHTTTNIPHLDILLIYDKRVHNPYTRYDYIIKHGNLTKYSTLNKAILNYNSKEDSSSLKTSKISKILLKSQASNKQGLYHMLETAMLQKPFTFSANDWIHKQKIRSEIIMTSWQSVIRAIEIEQQVVCRQILRAKPGIQTITPELIRSTLTPAQLREYNSWPGYAQIVAHLNQIPKWGWNRPHKTKNLYLVGPPDIGKTTLILELEKHCSTYNLGIKAGWFPFYQSHTYSLLKWNEFNLKNYEYPHLLQLLEGIHMTLPQKGGHVLKTDNQLIITTSNLTIEEHVHNKFWKLSDRQHAIANLKARFTQVLIPKNRKLFLLLPLIKEKKFKNLKI